MPHMQSIGLWAAMIAFGLTLMIGAQGPQPSPPSQPWGTAPAQQWQQPAQAPVQYAPPPAIQPQPGAPQYGQPPGGQSWGAVAPEPARQITFNTTPVSGQSLATLQQLELAYGVTLPNGHYWYDSVSGLWGPWGQGAASQLPAGLALGGPLPPNASGGGNGALTGVFINGRELHPTEIAHLQQITQVYPGRYWLDAQGYGGYEGQPASFNLLQLVQQAQSPQSSGGPWSHQSWSPEGNSYVGGDGQGFLYFSGPDGASFTVDSDGVVY